MAEHPDVSAQAFRLGAVLKDAGVPVKILGVRDTTHSRINDQLGLDTNPVTNEWLEFVTTALKRP